MKRAGSELCELKIQLPEGIQQGDGEVLLTKKLYV
jgi:hypothetical protein